MLNTHRKINVSVLISVFALLFSPVILAQDDLKLKLDSIANAGIEQGIPGIQILISKNEETYTYNYGYQDRDKTAEINDSTNWRIGSITKLFTATIILQLESEGKLSINDSVSHYVDLKQHNTAGITIKHLLNHTSGLYIYTKDRHLKWEDSMDQCLEYSLKRKLSFTPGSEYHYCNTGYLILGLIIEKLTGLSFNENLTERILEPCELKSMIYCEDEKTPSNTARGYNKKRKKYTDITDIDHSWANSAGAILSNSSDLNQFVKQLFNGALLDSTQLKKMITPTYLFRDLNAEGLEWFDHAVGLSWFLNLDKSERPIYVSHGGNTEGYNCDVHYNVQTGLSIVIGMNLFPTKDYEPVFSTQHQLIDTIHEYYKAKE